MNEADHVDLRLLQSLLWFFASDRANQKMLIRDYWNEVSTRHQQMHVSDPIVELVEGLESLVSRAAADNRLHEIQDEMKDIGALLELVLRRDHAELVSLSALEEMRFWEIVRRMCEVAMKKLPAVGRFNPVSVWQLLMHVSD